MKVKLPAVTLETIRVPLYAASLAPEKVTVWPLVKLQPVGAV